MEFQLNEEQQRLKAELKSFLSQQKVQSRERQLSTEEFTDGMWLAMAEKGWLGLNLSRKYGGAERPYIDTAIFLEELHYQRAPEIVRTWYDICVGTALHLINKYGSEELKNRFLPPIHQGKMRFSLCSTDTEGGSDIASVKTTAREEGDYFIVNGTKIYNDSNRGNNWTCMFIRTGTYESREKGLSVLLVDLKTPGINIGLFPFIWELDRAEVVFEDAKIPKENLVGEKNNGWTYVIDGIAGDWRALGNPGLLQRDFERYLEIAKGIKRGGQRIMDIVPVRNRLVELATELEIARYLFYHAYWVLDQGLPGVVEAGIAKIYNTSLWERLYNALIEISGQYGLLRLSPSARKFPVVSLALPIQYNFAPALKIGGWPVETVKSFIAKERFGLPTEIADYQF